MKQDWIAPPTPSRADRVRALRLALAVDDVDGVLFEQIIAETEAAGAVRPTVVALTRILTALWQERAGAAADCLGWLLDSEAEAL